MRFLSGVMASIARKGGVAGASIIPRVCDPSDLNSYALVIFSAGQVATTESPEALSGVVNGLVSARFTALGTFTVAAFDAKENAAIADAQAKAAEQAAEREAGRQSFAIRNAAVISAIYLRSPAPVVCLMAPDPDGVRYLLSRSDSPFSRFITPDTTIVGAGSANDIFIAMKSHSCSAAIAPAGALKEIVAAFVRENIPIEIASGYLDSRKLANWKVLKEQSLVAEQAAQAAALKAQREADAKQQAEAAEGKALEAQREKNDEAIRQQKMQQMRKLVASKATAVVESFVGQLRLYMQTVHDKVAAKQAPGMQPMSIFEPWADRFVTQVERGWEFQPVRASIEDYGRAQWKDRTIEAISVRVEFPMLNRVIGERRTDCIDFTWINDEEFGFWRNPMTVACDEHGAAFKAWADSNSFASQWQLLSH